MTAIDEVRQRIDIVEYIGETVPLQKAGRNFKACCPFHQEKTPSFFVFPDRQTWRCFGACAEGGDVFSFVMKRENAGFGEALRLLAQRAGVELETRDPGEAATEQRRRERAYLANREAAAFFAAQLQTAAGRTALDYLRGRHLAPDTIERFQLGYAPDSWDALGTSLRTLGFDGDELVDFGLLSRSERGSTYDRFRNKVMFPIADRDGRVIGFGSRVLDGSLPKYINSPQTLLFDKSSTLYGLDQAREAIRQEDQVVIVEGYMDVLAAHQAGFRNVVASLGTALTDRHVSTLKRLTRRIVLCLDGDQAGVDAMLRGYQVMVDAFDREMTPVPTARGLIRYQATANAEIRVMVLPWGKDPDDVIHEDPDAWRRLVFDARPVVDFILEATVARHDLRDPGGKRAVVEALTPVLNDLPDAVTRAHYIQRLASLVRIPEQQIATFAASRQPRRRSGPATPAPGLPGTRPDPVEQHALWLLLCHGQLRERGLEATPDLFQDPVHRALFLAWTDTGDLAELPSRLDDTTRERFATILGKPGLPAKIEVLERDWTQCHRRLLERQHRAQITAMTGLFEERGSTGDGSQQAKSDGAPDAADVQDLVQRNAQELRNLLKTTKAKRP